MTLGGLKVWPNEGDKNTDRLLFEVESANGERLGSMDFKRWAPRAVKQGPTIFFFSHTGQWFEEISAFHRTMGEARSNRDAPSRFEGCREGSHHF